MLARFTSACTAIICLFAGTMKLLDGPQNGELVGNLVVSPVVIACIAEVEVAIGIWILSGWRKQLAQASALTLMLLFTVVSSYHLALGGQYCTCIGSGKLLQVKARAFVMLILTVLLSILIALSLYKQRTSINSTP